MQKYVNMLRTTKQYIVKIVKSVGPGFITGSADDDPSGIGTYSIAGARYGLLLAWLFPFQLPFMFYIQEMCARIGIVTRNGLTQNMKLYFPKILVYGALVILVTANVINIGANISIMAYSIQLLIGNNVYLIALCITIAIIVITIFCSYHIYSKLLIIVALFLFSYVFTAILVTKNWLEIIFAAFTPHIIFDRDFILIMTGCIGTTISPYLFFWQTSQEIEDMADHELRDASPKTVEEKLQASRIDTFIGMAFSQLIGLFILITCFETLHMNGITHIASAADAALALKPLAGESTFLIFTLGIVAAGLLGIPVLAGSAAYALSELLDIQGGLSYKFKQARTFYLILSALIFLGLTIHIIGINPIQALLFAAIVNCVCAAPLVACIVLLANNQTIMGKYKNGITANIFGWATFGIITISTLLTIYYLF